MGNPNGDGRWITVEFDIHKGFKTTDSQAQASYDVVYGLVGNKAIPRTGSTFQAYAEYADAIRLAMAQADAILIEKGFLPMTVYVTPSAPSADNSQRERGASCIAALAAKVGKSLATSIAALEAKFDALTGDVNLFVRKGSLLLSKARRALEDARALAVAYAMTEDVRTAFAATEALIETESRKRELVKATGAVMAVRCAAQGLELIEELDG